MHSYSIDAPNHGHVADQMTNYLDIEAFPLKRRDKYSNSPPRLPPLLVLPPNTMHTPSHTSEYSVKGKDDKKERPSLSWHI